MQRRAARIVWPLRAGRPHVGWLGGRYGCASQRAQPPLAPDPRPRRCCPQSRWTTAASPPTSPTKHCTAQCRGRSTRLADRFYFLCASGASRRCGNGAETSRRCSASSRTTCLSGRCRLRSVSAATAARPRSRLTLTVAANSGGRRCRLWRRHEGDHRVDGHTQALHHLWRELPPKPQIFASRCTV